MLVRLFVEMDLHGYCVLLSRNFLCTRKLPCVRHLSRQLSVKSVKHAKQKSDSYNCGLYCVKVKEEIQHN